MNSVNIIAVALFAVLCSLALTFPSPDEPQWFPYEEQQQTEHDNAVRFVGGDGKTMLTGFWHLPPSSDTAATRAPVIVLAHGLGLVQSSGLDPFVDAFSSAGFAVFTFDYATFGKSDGLPRHQVYPNRQVKDIQAAIEMIQNDSSNNKLVDSSKIGLWGTSLAGGHALSVAAEATGSSSSSSSSSALRAVVSQVPHTASGLEAVLFSTMVNTPVEGVTSVSYFVLGLLKWIAYKLTNQGTTYYTLTGAPSSAAFMANAGDKEGYLGLVPPKTYEEGWNNAATTDSGLAVLFYRPLSAIKASSMKNNATLPVLLVAAQDDTLCPSQYVLEAKEQIKDAEIVTLPNAGHFDIYKGEELQTTLESEVAFFKKHLLL